MLEMLLVQYEEMFGEPFPLKQFAGTPEIDVINIIYDCILNRLPYDPHRKLKYTVTGAPTSK